MAKIITGDELVLLRFLTPDDAASLARLANNINVSKNLRDGFPSPYTLDDAKRFIAKTLENPFPNELAIVYRGEYAGNIGITPGVDVYRKSAEIGYFIGEPFWNKGITTRALNLMTHWVFKNTRFVRLWAGVFDFNLASQRVLEKCGYLKEAELEMAIFKNGNFFNEVRFAKVNRDRISNYES
jgi:[ribosomal protein S5]-alanine N-acetyltransferase